MFVHVRALEMLRKHQEVTVFVPYIESLEYVYENVTIKRMPSKNINTHLLDFEICYIHLLNIYPFRKENGWPIYKHIQKENIPFAFFVHGNDVQKYSNRMFEFRYKPKDFLKWFKKDVMVIPRLRHFLRTTKSNINSKCLFPSLWMKEEAERNLNISIERFDIVPTGIETNFFQFNDVSKNIRKLVTIRSLSQKVYDIEKTIEVMSLLPIDYSLDIYGEGNYISDYQSLIDSLNLGSRVRIISGFVEKNEMRELFKKYGIYISTTKMDSQGVNMMEAMSSGLLVATTDNSSKKEFIENTINGVLGVNADDLAKNILEVTADKKLFIEICKAGRKSIEAIDITLTVEKELRVLKSLTKGNADS